ncbi:response regulator [Marinicauda algicola]|uniref:Response regulator n=1 Tax=Marinicauda algicola TaxID=2029849 RepID=A0A4S2GXF2_9PROT|nr:response regulator [Marinicauda algicola]TGY87568.1 response regulator [Marinicauda algicola]
MPRSRPTVLVVEDDAIIALDMKSMLEQCGCVVMGPASSIERALTLLESETPDAGVLDINLREERIWPVARALHERGTPFVLASGYSRVEVDPAFQSAPLLSKPVLISDIRRGLARIGILKDGG